jgi:hypothetical protein
MTNEQLEKELLRLTGKTPKKENEFDVVDADAEDITDPSDLPESE